MFQKKKRIDNRKLIESLRGKPCTVCERPGIAHHVYTVGHRGHDVEWNLCVLCPKHHEMVHKLGTCTMSARFDEFRQWLSDHGWEYNFLKKKWEHYGNT